MKGEVVDTGIFDNNGNVVWSVKMVGIGATYPIDMSALGNSGIIPGDKVTFETERNTPIDETPWAIVIKGNDTRE